MPRQTEPSANSALGNILTRMLPSCDVRSENTRQIVDNPALRLDILITESGRSPVVIEAEFMPAYSAEPEAKSRLGLEVVGTAKHIDAAIALRYPERITDADDLNAALEAESGLSYCVCYKNGSRFPESGWLEGSAEDLVDLIRLISVPQQAVDEAVATLEKGIDRAAAILEQLAKSKPGIVTNIAQHMGLSKVLQTYRMAGAMVANAMVFHERLAGLHGVAPLSQICSSSARNPKEGMLEAWNAILKVDYFPIFDIARKIVNELPAAEAAQMLTNLRSTVEDVIATGMNHAQDLTGHIFQRLIADRKYLATFYTLPETAALLARLAVAKMDVDWSDADAIGNLKIGDFACGTGALIAAVYSRIRALHERADGDLAALHPTMMEEALYGCDVLPSAVHITGSTLSGAEPQVKFGKTQLYSLAYGRRDDGSVLIGSLELLQSSSVMTLFNMSDPGTQVSSSGEETAEQVRMNIQDGAFDLVIMNPPFTRNVTREGATAGTFAAAFAAFGATKADQKDMAKRMNILKRDTVYHGSAGIASAFVSLGDRKLKPGGVLALVLPLTVASGSSWQAARKMLGKGYTDLSVLSIASNSKEMSFSSDTAMAECLIIARKLRAEERRGERGKFVSLDHRPRGFPESSETAREISTLESIRGIEDGPYGGSNLAVGSSKIGEVIAAPVSESGESWGSVRLMDASLAQTAFALSQSRLWLPGRPAAIDLDCAPLGNIGKLGTYHLDIDGPPPRGPFDKISPSPTATYPSLWNHNAKNETRMICEPDSQLQVRQGMETKAATVWATASRAHLNLDFRLNSQPLAASFTERETVGGTAWPNVIFDDNRFDYAFTVWSNTTLGLLCFWWHSNRQQPGRVRLTATSAETLPVLDFRALSDDQLATAERIFDDFRERELKPAYIADADPNRALLDRRVVCDLLGLDEGVYSAVRRLSAKWCAEPSVHGGKRRPKGAAFVM